MPTQCKPARRAGNLTPRPQINDTHEHLSAMAEGHGQSGGKHHAPSPA